jgi:hypothetical protein
MIALRTLQAVISLVACVASSAALGQQTRWVGFGPGMEVRLSPYLWSKLRDDSTLEVVSRQGAVIHFVLELKAAGGTSRRSGETAVRDLAKKMDLKLHESGDKLVLMEPRTQGILDGRETRRMGIHIGFGRSVVVMDLTVFESEKDAPLVRQFFDADMERIILSLRSKRA